MKETSLDLSKAPLRAFSWFTLGATVIGVATFALVNLFMLGDVSQSADTIAAISGFAISVSGSVVAIVLAARALQQQDEISEVEKRMEAREAERELRESIAPYRDYLAANREAFLAVEAAAVRLAERTDVPQAELEKPEVQTRVLAARDEAAHALNDLANHLAGWPDVKLLADTVQMPRRANASPHETDVRRIVTRTSEVFEKLHKLAQMEKIKAKRAAHAQHEIDQMQEADENRKAQEEDVIGSAAIFGKNLDVGPDRYVSVWFSCRPEQPERPRTIISGFETFGTATQPALPECIDLIREMAADLSSATVKTLWSRRLQATFATQTQAMAVFDPADPGGYHMEAEVRYPLYRKRLPETEASKKRGLKRSEWVRTPPSESQEIWLLETANWINGHQKREAVSPLNSLLMLCNPAGYFPTHELGKGLELAKGGDLPLFPLILNRGAGIMLRTVAELPSSGDIEAAVRRKFPDLPGTAMRMIPAKDIDVFGLTALPSILPTLLEAPDMVFCPSLVDKRHLRHFELAGVALDEDAKEAAERAKWPPYPEWPGEGKKRPKLDWDRVKARAAQQAEG